MLDTDERNAFKAGYARGKDCGPCSPRGAEIQLDALGIPATHTNANLFCNGTDDGAAGDPFRLARVNG